MVARMILMFLSTWLVLLIPPFTALMVTKGLFNISDGWAMILSAGGIFLAVSQFNVNMRRLHKFGEKLSGNTNNNLSINELWLMYSLQYRILRFVGILFFMFALAATGFATSFIQKQGILIYLANLACLIFAAFYEKDVMRNPNLEKPEITVPVRILEFFIICAVAFVYTMILQQLYSLGFIKLFGAKNMVWHNYLIIPILYVIYMFSRDFSKRNVINIFLSDKSANEESENNKINDKQKNISNKAELSPIKNQDIDSKRETLSKEQERFILPFSIKNKSEFILSNGLQANCSVNDLVAHIQQITTGYTKLQLNAESDFYDSYFKPPVFNSDSLTTQNLDILGQFIHDFVWHTINNNAAVLNSDRLLYGSKYKPYLLEITENLDNARTAIGVQVYTESLIDYYVMKIKANREAQKQTIVQTEVVQENLIQSQVNPIADEVNKNIAPDVEDKVEVEEKGSGALLAILYVIMCACLVCSYFIKPKFDLSGEAMLTLGGIGFALAVYAVIRAKQKFRDINLFLIFCFPCALIYMASVVMEM